MAWRVFRMVVVCVAWLGLLAGACAAANPSSRAGTTSGWDVTFKDLDGRVTTLQHYAGKVVVLHIFTSWDVPGLRQVADLNALVRQRKDVQAVGVGMDLEGALAMRSFVKTLKPDYPVLLPDAAFVEGRTLFGRTQEVPRLFIVGKDGALRGGYAGYVPYAELIKMVDAELKRN